MKREDIRKTIERLDALLGETKDPERARMGMGIRLALGMAQELREGVPLGSQTGDMVALWTDEWGQDAVDRAVQIARQFLTRPDELRKAMGQKLGLDDSGRPLAGDGEDPAADPAP